MKWGEFKAESEKLIETDGYVAVEKDEFEWISKQIEKVEQYERMFNLCPSWFTKEVYLSYKKQGMTDEKIRKEVLFVSLTTFRKIKRELGVIGVKVSCDYRPNLKEYAVYKGEEYVFSGTARECAEFLGVKPQTVRERITRTKQGKRILTYSIFLIKED